MELILFIILGGYLLLRIGADKGASKSASRSSEQRFEWHDARLEEWGKLVSDRALEEDLSYFIKDPHNYDEVWNEVHDAYLQMPSCKTFTRILLYPSMVEQCYGKGKYTKKQRENIAAANCKEALNIMLARRGKVRDFYICTDCTLEGLCAGEGAHSKQVWDEQFDLWVYIRDELRRHGVPARLIFKTDGYQDHEKAPYDADDVSEFHYQSGDLTWLQVTYFDEDLKYV